MLEYEIIVFLQLVLLAAVIILREPKLLIPCVVLGLPFEYVATQTLSSLGESGTGGIIRTLLNPGKAAMLATVGIAIIRARHNPRKLFPDSEIMLPLTVLTVVVFLGVAWSDSMRPSNGVLIMPMYVAFVFAAPSLIEDRKDLERIVAAFLIAAALLSVVAIAQRVLGVFQWRSILVQSDDYSYRSNAFFADPNNLARFLAISIALAAGLIMVTGPRRMTVYLAAPMLAVSAAGIVTTASRSGWLGMLLASFLVVMMSPIRGYTKARLTVVAFGGLAFLLALVFMQGGANAERVKSLTSGIQLIGQREFLIKGGWEMWKDNPLVGVGSGNYQHTLITSYLWTLPGGRRPRSRTPRSSASSPNSASSAWASSRSSPSAWALPAGPPSGCTATAIRGCSQRGAWRRSSRSCSSRNPKGACSKSHSSTWCSPS